MTCSLVHAKGSYAPTMFQARLQTRLQFDQLGAWFSGRKENREWTNTRNNKKNQTFLCMDTMSA